MAQSEDPGSSLPAGSEVEFVIETPGVIAPMLTGLDADTALTALSEAGFLTEEPEGLPSAAIVSGQGLDPESEHGFGALMPLTYSVVVPDVVGRPAREASISAAATGLKTQIDPAAESAAGAVVIRQPLEPGSTQAFETELGLDFGVTVPDLTDLTPSEAAEAYATAGLQLVIEPANAAYDWNLTSSSVAPGTVVPLGSSVTAVYKMPVYEYRVTGTGSRAMITWSPPDSFSIAQDTSAALPWVMEFPYYGGDSYGNFNALSSSGSEITCTLTADGRVVDQQTSYGQYAMVMCGM